MMRAKIQSGANRLSEYNLPLVSTNRSARRPENRIAGGIGSSQPSTMVLPANTGDHPLVLKFLKQSQAVDESEFLQTLDCPNYEPQHRLLIRSAGEIIAHVRIIPRELRFGKSAISTYHLSEICALPEFRQAACLRLLLAAVRQRAAANHIALITTSPERPEILRRMGWTSVKTGIDVTTSPYSMLASLEEMNDASPESQWKKKYEIRPLRFVDQPTMATLYASAAENNYGMIERSQEDWLWLMGRRGYDRAFAAFERAKGSKAETLVGYCILRKNHVVELIASQSHGLATFGLLQRAASDVVERGVHSIVMAADSAPGLEMHGFPSVDLFKTTAACIPSPHDFLKAVAAELGSRARSNGATVGTKIGLICGTDSLSLEVTGTKLKVKRNESVRSRIQLAPSMMTRLALGCVDVGNVEMDEFSATTKMAVDAAERIFPRRRFLQMPLDNLRTLD
jgi:hypothetical protein